MTGPLEGLLVADFSRVLAGPYCTMLLADLGATVVKVEGPDGDETRRWMPPSAGDDATYFLSVNRGKRGIVLDLADPADAEVARALAARADVVVQNFLPGTAAKWDLDYDSVRTSNPGAVYASISGFGADSPQPGYDVLAQALSGFMSVTGEPGGPPTKAGVAIVDVVTGLHAAVGILAALHHRDRTGEGQHVEVNLLSSALSALANQTGAWAFAGVVPQRLGNEHPSIFPYGPFPTADGDLVIAIGNDRQFARLREGLGMPVDERFRAAADRSLRRDELRPLLVAALASRSARAWHEVLSGSGVPCAPILDIAEAFALADRLGLAPLARTADGDVVGTRSPVQFSESPVEYRLTPPTPDRDRDWVEREVVARDREGGRFGA
ncbi:CaiB/BaiF CoA-transferase family protein [Microbacterium aoyamense]|uniref:CaiB/BaiF CoA-transferase family protein n=1 Tax=Microbacterium aoyamense TaxID=344166 RepID=A0ABN2PIZ0_9MICO|nr:CoA transferase [Microbacterium aoyamense]